MSKRLDERTRDFFNALDRLNEALKKDINDDIIVDGIIQRFEFTFELGWKTIKLYLENQGIVDEATTPRSTIKAAFKYKVIKDGDIWIAMMLDRNRTSHIYDEYTARKIVGKIKTDYINELEELRSFLK